VLAVDWQRERYVRVYCRDTATWQRLGFAGQCVLMQLLRVLDNDGHVDLGGSEPWHFAADLFGAPESIAQEGMAALLQLGVVECRGGGLVVPNFHQAQTAVKSGAQRMREYRERHRPALRNVTAQGSQPPTYTPSNGLHDVTKRNDPLRGVTRRDASLRNVTGQNGCGTPPYEDDPNQIPLPSPPPWTQLLKTWERAALNGMPCGDPESHKKLLASLWTACVARDAADPLGVFRRAAEAYVAAQQGKRKPVIFRWFAADFDQWANTHKSGRKTSPMIEELTRKESLHAQAVRDGDVEAERRLFREIADLGERMARRA
jgi:hypothetical protein